MNENPNKPADGSETPNSVGNGRRYWIDEDGNVHGVVLSMEVDHFIEFTDKAIDLTSGAQDSGTAAS
jgi:hypothetical protein